MSVPKSEERANWWMFHRELKKRGLGGATSESWGRIVKLAMRFKNVPLERWRQADADAFLLHLEQLRTETGRPKSRPLRLVPMPANGVPDDVPLYE